LKPTFRDAKGFTLVEVLIALGMMMVGLIALWGLHMTSVKVDIRNNNETRAVFHAERILEQLRATAVTNFGALAGGNDIPEAPFTRTWVVNAVNTWRRDIAVTVTWNERITTSTGQRAAVPRTVQLSTILCSN
jgi:Tfp pilus assembly protein PilV